MRSSRGIASLLAIIAGLAMVVAGPIMIYKGFDGQSQVKDQLSAQKIVFPPAGSEGLPAAQAKYAGETVDTGTEAKAYADMVETHVLQTTEGRTYSQVSDEWRAGGMKDEELGALRQTAFMGESLRGSLMGAYQAWQITYLVIGLGALVAGLGFVFGAMGVALRPRRIVVPDSPQALLHPEVLHN